MQIDPRRDGWTVVAANTENPDYGFTKILHHVAGCDIETRWPMCHAETATDAQIDAAEYFCIHCLEALGLPETSRPPRPDPDRQANADRDAARSEAIFGKRRAQG